MTAVVFAKVITVSFFLLSIVKRGSFENCFLLEVAYFIGNTTVGGNIRQPLRIKTNTITQVTQYNLYDN
jgi:hypothetical protein